ncbi:MAG: hypothetical protein IJB59_03450 [Oscillospiraceae bacterium]|nr:hypothetical protein [Oscillospiraceae bacterium]
MSIPYRHQRVLNRLGTVLLILLIIFIIVWLCWVVWLQRYVIYTSKGATIDFNQSSYDSSGKEAVPPKAAQQVSIYYNEGADAINTSTDMEQINGYYISSEMFQQDMDNIMLQVERLKSGTAVMIDMKSDYGSFYYDSTLPDAVISASTNIESVTKLVDKLHTKGFHTIARISAFRDYSYGLNHVSAGLYMLNRKGLWMDAGGMYWMNPANAVSTNWITDVVLELKKMGFDEVMLDNFCFPTSDQYIFTDDKPAALAQAAQTLMSTCGSEDFVLSFCVEDPTFALPEGRCRMYLKNVDAGSIAQKANLVTFEDPDIRLCFLAETADTRYDDYCVLRTIYVAEEVEARKAG